MQLRIAKAASGHAMRLARLQDMADDRLPRLFWEAARAEGETIWDAGARSFSTEAMRADVRVALRGTEVAGAAQSYRMEDPPAASIPDVAPLADLKASFVGDWYLDFLAVDPAARRSGVASALLADVARRAARGGAARMFLIVLERNAPARRLYERDGWSEAARTRLAPARWPIPPQDAIALVKPCG